MRQIWIPKYGEPEVLEVREAPDPTPKAGEVRIRVQFSGVNYADTMARMGLYFDAPPPPMVVGYEVSGVVDAVGEGVASDWLNAPVLALTRFGGYSNVVCVPLVQVSHRPTTMSPEEAAALPVNTVTAYQMLVVMGSVRPGDQVLIHGAAGGVGWVAVQMAKLLGATVYGTASASKHPLLLELGVDACIDYRHQDFEQEIRKLTGGQGVEVVLDAIGGSNFMKSYRALAPTGRLIMYGISQISPGEKRSVFSAAKFALQMPWLAFNPARLMNENKGVLGVNVGHLWDQQARIKNWIDQIIMWHGEGKLKPRIDAVFTFNEAASAHRRLHSRENVGKVLLKP